MDRKSNVISSTSDTFPPGMLPPIKRTSLDRRTSMDRRTSWDKRTSLDIPKLQKRPVFTASSNEDNAIKIISPYEKAVANQVYKTLYPNKVYTPWYRRYVDKLPMHQQIDFQPMDEVQKRDEDIALHYFYGEEATKIGTEREGLEKRRWALRRYNKMKEQQEKIKTEEPAKADGGVMKAPSIRSIIAASKAKTPDFKAEFGPTIAERQKIVPIIEFLDKLHLKKVRLFRNKSLDQLKSTSKWRVLRTPLVNMKIKKMYHDIMKGKVRTRFRRVINLVRCVYRFIHVISLISGDTKLIVAEVRNFKAQQMKQTMLQMQQSEREGKASKKEKVVFDPAKYKFSMQLLAFPMTLKMILTKPWFERSNEEIEAVIERLQVLRSFVQYPTAFQRRLAQVAWFIEVPADKVIIRERHIAFDFYFLLSGKAKMVKLYGNPYIKEYGDFRVLRFIKKDDVFGDESMSSPNSEREYSVITTVSSVLLSINVHDYLNMLMSKRDDEEAPEHIMFISNLEFLQNFPKLKLIEEGDENITLYYFRAKTLIAKSLKDASYVFVVKYGSCRVLVELPPPRSAVERYEKSVIKRVPSIQVEQQSETPKRTLSSLVRNIEEEKNVPIKHRHSGVFKNALQTSKDRLMNSSWMSERLADQEKKLGSAIATQRAGLQEEVETVKRKVRRLSHGFHELHLARFSDSHNMEAIKDEDSGEGSRHTLDTLPPLEGSSAQMVKDKFLEPHSSRMMSGSVSLKGSATDAIERTESENSIGASSARSVTFLIKDDAVAPSQKLSTSKMKNLIVGTKMELSDTVARKLAFTGNYDGESKDASSLAVFMDNQDIFMPSGTQECSRWKLVRTMVKGDYTGLEWLDYNNGPFDPPKEEMSLVSDGCELIMIRKTFLLKYLRKEW